MHDATLTPRTAAETVNLVAFETLRDKFPAERVRRGTVLIRQSDPPDCFYLVIAGQFVVLRPDTRETIAEIGPGEPVGELAFFAQSERTGDVVATRNSEVLVVTGETYERLVREAPQIFAGMFEAVAKRLANVVGVSPAIRPKPPRTIALLPIGRETKLPPGFIGALADAMGPTAHAISADMAGISEETAENALREKLAATEESGEIVLFALERKNSPFTEACLNLADQLLLIAPSSDLGADAEVPTGFEREAADRFVFTDRALVVWREKAGTPITGTAKWLEPRDVKLHHHVALDTREDFERLGRFLSGSALGFVLGGGMALGFAHVGVAKALMEAGETIDFYGGTSIGAALGGSLALGNPPDVVVDQIEDTFVRHRAMRRWTVPVHALLDPRVFDERLRHTYSDAVIEDMHNKFFAVASNLSTNSGHVLRRGLLWEAIRATAAVPGLLPPFITSTGEVLVDGVLFDNIPLGVMHDLKSGPNVIIKLTPSSRWLVSSPYAGFPTPLSQLRRLLFRRKGPYYPPMSSIFMRSLLFASEQRRTAATEDDYFFDLPQDATRIGFTDWKKGRRVAEAAYRHMAALLEQAGSLSALIKGDA